MKTLAVSACFLILSTSIHAANWGQWRGPNFNGSTSETGLPQDWSTTKNVVWSADLPGASAATPIVWDDHVFISSTDSEKDTLCAMCFDRKTGKLLWRHDVAQRNSQRLAQQFRFLIPRDRWRDRRLLLWQWGLACLRFRRPEAMVAKHPGRLWRVCLPLDV